MGTLSKNLFKDPWRILNIILSWIYLMNFNQKTIYNKNQKKQAIFGAIYKKE